MKVAIVSPQTDAYSETFIRVHRELLKDEVLYYSGGNIPLYLDLQPIHPGRYHKDQLKYLIRSLLSSRPISAEPYFFRRSLQKYKPDVILAEYGPTAAVILPEVTLTKIPMVVHFHGYDASRITTLQQYGEAYKLVFQYASRIIAVSEIMKNSLVKLGCPPEKIIQTCYGPDPSFFQNQPDFQNKSLLAVGRFVEKKAPYYTLMAFHSALQKVPEATLMMVGEGPLKPVCQDLANLLGISSRVSFPGILTPQEIKESMHYSLAFVQHSKTASDGDMEGTPVSILEAQAACLPVVSTIHAGIPEVVIHEETGLLVKEKDIQGMASHMVRLLRNPDEAARMGIAGRRRIMDHFTLDQYIATLQRTLEDAVRQT